MNRFLLILSIVFLGFMGASAQTTIEGKVTDEETGESVISGVVKAFRNGVYITGTETDFDGNYFFSNVQPGTYDLEVEYIGYSVQKQTNIVIKAGRTNRIDFKLTNDNVLQEVQIIEYKVPLIEIDNTTQGTTVTAEKIRSMPTKSVQAIAASSAGISSRDGGDISIRGSRSNETVYFLDGVRVSGNLIPQSEIEQLQVVIGGIEARYGDVTGGVISLTSKGPSNKISGSIEAEKSFDGFGYNLLSANIAGPIIRNKKNQSVLGYRFSGQYRTVADNNPSATGVWRAPESVIRKLEAAPTYSINGTKFASLEQLRTSDIGGGTLKARPNEDNTDIDLTGRIDVRVNDNIDIQISGNYNDKKDRFLPSNAWGLLNWVNNPYKYENTYRGNFRLTHKLGRQSLDEASAGEKSNSTLKNLYYTFTLGYQKSLSREEDFRHEGNLFNYGYYGRTLRTWEPVFGYQDPTDLETFQHLGFREIIGESTLDGVINPIAGSYAALNGSLINGLDNDVLNSGWGIFSNVGRVYDNFTKSDDDLYSFNLVTGFDLLPGGSEKGRHNIQLGFLYEQSIDRNYDINPVELWLLADGFANNHINGVDTSKIVDTMRVLQPIQGTFVSVDKEVYATKIVTDKDNKFYRSVRDLLSTSTNVVTDNDYVNVWEIDPSQMTLDMFSANELINRPNLISYEGYDHIGNKVGSDVRFEDFFTGRDANGKRSFVVAPQQPIYGAVFLQDKFSYKDIIFRLGMRVDYFDANTKVVRDPYALYEIENAKDYYTRINKPQPASVGDDYNVYVESLESDGLVAFRKGDQWYQPNGTAVSGGNVIYQEGLVYPSYAGRTQNRDLNIQSANFDVNTSFVDYKPQINFMPRLAFSFPISEDAGFFAHYDVLYQRPPSNSYASPLDYYFWENVNRINPDGAALDNPNLKPVRTVDYEVGFQQKVSSTAAMKVSAYYKEVKDLIQQRTFANVATPVDEYKMFDNLDFGTVKGFSFSLDRRRTNNIEINATYTLQFADGSGSDANSSNGINRRGPIRTLQPLSYDERHRITTVIDYKFPGGKSYAGPKLGNFNVLADLNITMTNFLVSGQPYTRNQTVAAFGGSGYASSINGARLPWNFISDLNVTKRFPVTINKESGKALFFNAYCRVQNLFNTRNIVDLYKFSNDAYDDGYLSSSFGVDRERNVINTGRDLQAFRDAYSWRLNAPGNFNLPRRIYVGVIMDF